MKKRILLATVLCCIGLLNVFAQTSNYVVLSSSSDTTDTYYQAAQTLNNYRGGQLITFNPALVDSLLPVLTALEPRYVAIVLKPIELDINFVREFLMMSTNLDTDPFSDFAYGYITGATGQDALNFVDTIIYADSHNIQNFPLNVSGYAASSINYVYTSTSGFLSYLNPPSYSDIYLETNDNGSGVDYFNANTGYLQNNKLLDIGYNGDPHMLWLFEGGNTNPSPPVWSYDSTKIEDTAYARAGITSYDIAQLNLYPAVAYNGACHSGEPKRVMVEGDIAATFGDPGSYIKFYTMSDTFSFALNMLNTGITGYFAPCGANNANDQGEEIYNTFLYEEPLGDIFKRSLDGVVMGFFGNRPALKIYQLGDLAYGCDVLTSGSFDPANWSGACYMLGGKANRIYFGDPMYNPFENNHSPSLDITTASLDSISPTVMDINLNFNKPDVYFPIWDKFHYSDSRIYYRVELPDYVGDITSFQVIDSSGAYYTAFYAIEKFDGKNYMHIEVDIPDDMYGAINYYIKFRINFLNTVDNEAIASNGMVVKVFPNPTNGQITITFGKHSAKNISLVITNCSGQVVKEIGNLSGNSVSFDSKDMSSGLYFFHFKGMTAKGKFVVE